ncbi:MAG: glycine zipper domain-containing protein [Candidatus Melainabacteria bacterium]|nr:glycine zipper domain-containing protein [Candidatus Melainabacteria bacterium]
MRTILSIFSLAAVLFLGGCATPLGQQYGLIGAAGGAIIGGAITGDATGAIIGATAGALGGGAIGDQQTFDSQRHYQGRPRGYQQPCYDCAPPQRYRPCREFREPVYDNWGYLVGYRRICR